MHPVQNPLCLIEITVVNISPDLPLQLRLICITLLALLPVLLTLVLGPVGTALGGGAVAIGLTFALILISSPAFFMRKS